MIIVFADDQTVGVFPDIDPFAKRAKQSTWRDGVSRGEWRAHEAIKDIHMEYDDPEAVWVEAQPEDIHTYLRLKSLLADVQRELDESWAVLGEGYGPREELRQLGIAIRRIKSNLDDVKRFSRTVAYIPRRA